MVPSSLGLAHSSDSCRRDRREDHLFLHVGSIVSSLVSGALGGQVLELDVLGPHLPRSLVLWPYSPSASPPPSFPHPPCSWGQPQVWGGTQQNQVKGIVPTPESEKRPSPFSD